MTAQSKIIADAQITESTCDNPFSLVWYFALMVPARNAISWVVSIIIKLFFRKSSASGNRLSAPSRMKISARDFIENLLNFFGSFGVQKIFKQDAGVKKHLTVVLLVFCHLLSSL